MNGNETHVLLEIGDHLGSTSIVIDRQTSELVERESYLAYGGADSDYRPQRWNYFREDYRFTGKEEDVEVGLQYFGKRFYAPALQRWISPDPLAVHEPGEADANLYAYVSGQALRAIDPLGLDCGPDYCATGGATGPKQGDDSLPSTSSYQAPLINQTVSVTAEPEHEVKQKFSSTVKSGGKPAAGAIAGYEFGTVAGEVPVAGGAASWLVAYMIDKYGPAEFSGGFGVGLTASSIPLGVKGGGEIRAGFRVAETNAGRFLGALAIADGLATVTNALANASAGIWMMSKNGPVTREGRLRELADDPNVSRSDKGWIRNEQRQVEQGKRSAERNPPGKDLRHPPGRPKAQGHDYAETQLQDRATHRTQHRHLVERSTGTTVRKPKTPPKPGPNLP